jgi:phosphoenolpyruvate carboxylase
MRVIMRNPNAKREMPNSKIQMSNEAQNPNAKSKKSKCQNPNVKFGI